METQQILNQKVDLLKKDIQELIDNYKLEKDSEKKIKLKDKKNIYLEELDTVLSQIKQIQKEEKRKSNNENEIKKIIRTNDSMKYHSLKNKPNAVQLMQEQKENREKAKNIFEKKLVLKEEYFQLEKELKCEEYPAFLFFDRNIIDKYKICPFIILNTETLENRKRWLLETFDKGKLYDDLYDNIINKKRLNETINQKENVEEFFEEVHNTLSEDNKKILDKIHEYLKEYNAATVKTKKLKEKFNVVINNTSTLVKVTDYKIHEYLSLYYKLVIPINEIANVKKDIILKQQELINNMNVNIYNEKVDEYNKIKNDIESAKKFLLNTSNNLNQELYDYLYKKSNEKKIIRQHGKYFKKWSVMNKDEKIDRYESYADYFVKKYLVEANIITGTNLIEELTIKLKTLLTVDGFERIKYKNLKWNVTGGIIENIGCLKWEDDKKEFFLTVEKELQKKVIDGTGTVKKISSIRTILNKDTNKIINEELMIHLILAKKQKKLKQENIKELKDLFLEKIKTKLKLKRIMINDRNEIYKKFDDIFNKIFNSNYSE